MSGDSEIPGAGGRYGTTSAVSHCDDVHLYQVQIVTLQSNTSTLLNLLFGLNRIRVEYFVHA